MTKQKASEVLLLVLWFLLVFSLAMIVGSDR